MTALLEYIRVAWRNLRANRGRSILTMLGIIIGISSVIMIIAAGGGARNLINDELNTAFSGMIYFYIDDESKAGFANFTEDDLEYINDNSTGHIHGATQANAETYGKAQSIRGSFDVNIKPGTVAMEYQSTEPIVKGRFFSQSEYDSAAAVGVISEGLAKQMFGTTDVVGKTMELFTNDVSSEILITGVRHTKDTSMIGAALVGTTDNVIEVPYSLLERRFNIKPYNSYLLLIIADNEYSLESADTVRKLLESKHNIREENAFGVESWTDAAKQYDSILGIITTFVGVVAGIALLVGGIGVMNIMLVSVTERTREIGIRKSLGARTKAIMVQFMAEAGMLTLVGGIIGIIIGLLLGTVICNIIGARPDFSFGSICIATAFSCGIGLFFGIYPARKAARLNPIEALRHE